MSAEPSEFEDLSEIANDLGIGDQQLPPVERRTFDHQGDAISYLKWGEDAPEILFLHGGGQNARTWDKVALILGRSAIAVDLPGHGRSGWRKDRDYWPWRNASTVAALVRDVSESALDVVGMSLGGLTAIRMAGTHPGLVKTLTVVDVTPNVVTRTSGMSDSQRGTTRFVGEPRHFASQDEMVSLVRAAAPHRPIADLVRGVRHNSFQLADGSWRWRYDVMDPTSLPGDFTGLWADIEKIESPTALVVGGDSAFVADEDIEDVRSRLPDARVHRVDGAGHSVQSDRPDALASLLGKSTKKQSLK